MQPQEFRHRLSFPPKTIKYAMSRHDLESKGLETYEHYRYGLVVAEHLKLLAGGDA